MGSNDVSFVTALLEHAGDLSAGVKERLRQMRAGRAGRDDLRGIPLIPHDWDGLEFEPSDDPPPGYEWVDDA